MQLLPVLAVAFLPCCWCWSATASSLYSADDPLWELNGSNFHQIVLGKSSAWIVEFYNSWCGHCIRFAPTWKEFARDTKTWRNVINVAAVNCADSENVKLCQEYTVGNVPTLKLFWTYANETTKGQQLFGGRDVSTIENSIIKFLESHWEEGVPASWPSIQHIGVLNIKSLISLIPDSEDSAYLFVELPTSFVGRKVILDLSFQKSVFIMRALSNNSALLNDLQVDTNSSFMHFLKIERTGDVETLFRFTNTNSSYIRDVIFEAIVGHQRSTSQAFPSKKNITIEMSSPYALHMADLENALHYSLKQEVGLYKLISGPRLDSLKAYLRVLKTFFPGSSAIIGYLSKLNHWISQKHDNVSGENFLYAVDKLQNKREYLPKMHKWIACKGSEPKYRGYPCSLWLLFHSLTIRAYDLYEKDVCTKEDVVRVLLTIRNYVRYFFTCKECSRNFETMAKNIERDVDSPEDVVLWLWNAHNAVNHRLEGDVTEDPKHPKVQFPAASLCLQCRIPSESPKEIKWKKSVVLKYLQHQYGKKNLLNSNDYQIEHFKPLPIVRINNASVVITYKTVSVLEKWNFQWFTNTDISLCVSLYFISALLIIVICLLFRQRHKRRNSHRKYIKLFP